MEELGGHRSRQGVEGGDCPVPFHGAHPERRGWTHQRSAAAVPSGSPSHSFSSDCSRYSSAQRAGDTDKGSARSREVGSQQGSREGRT